MYIDYVYLYILELMMALQIANPAVVAKVAELAALTGLSKTAAVEKAVDEMLKAVAKPKNDDFERQLMSLLAQIDALPLDPNADPNFELEWDEWGLPK